MIVTGLFLFTYQSTTFDVGGFILVMSASVITGLRWTTAQLFLQKEELGGCGLGCSLDCVVGRLEGGNSGINIYAISKSMV